MTKPTIQDIIDELGKTPHDYNNCRVKIQNYSPKTDFFTLGKDFGGKAGTLTLFEYCIKSAFAVEDRHNAGLQDWLFFSSMTSDLIKETGKIPYYPKFKKTIHDLFNKKEYAFAADLLEHMDKSDPQVKDAIFELLYENRNGELNTIKLLVQNGASRKHKKSDGKTYEIKDNDFDEDNGINNRHLLRKVETAKSATLGTGILGGGLSTLGAAFGIGALWHKDDYTFFDVELNPLHSKLVATATIVVGVILAVALATYYTYKVKMPSLEVIDPTIGNSRHSNIE